MQDEFAYERSNLEDHMPAKTSYAGEQWRRKPHDLDHDSAPSSGKWRQPIGGASAAVSNDGANSFSMVTNNFEAKSHAYPHRPNMMFNTLYSGAA